MTHDDFSPHKDSAFRMLGEGGAEDLRLIEINHLGKTSDDAGKPFSLVFLAPGEALWPQGIYRLVHDRMGMLEIFLVPIGPTREGMQYEAVFN